jgi:CHAD domain-containing protein
MTSRVERAISRAAGDRQVQVAAASVAAAGAAAVAGKAGIEHLLERGGGDDEGPSRAYRLEAGEKTKKGLPRIAAGRVETALEHVSAARDGDGAAAIHDARKDLKKLRSLLRLVRSRIGEDTYRCENRRYREASKSLAGARDATVMLETLDALSNRYEGRLPSRSVAGFRRRLEEQRQRAEPDLEVATALIAQGRAGLDDWAAQSGGWKLIEPGLRRSYRKGRKRMARVASAPTTENVHEWRKRGKDLWYQLRIVHDAWPELIGATADQVHELTDLLGDHHDLAVLRAEAGRHREVFSSSGDLKRLVGLIGSRQIELLNRALNLGDRLYSEKPKVFTARLGSYWTSWRDS